MPLNVSSAFATFAAYLMFVQEQELAA